MATRLPAAVSSADEDNNNNNNKDFVASADDDDTAANNNTMFAELNAAMADAWADLVATALRQGCCQGLPRQLAPAQEGILPQYYRNIDIAEAYCQRNIFVSPVGDKVNKKRGGVVVPGKTRGELSNKENNALSCQHTNNDDYYNNNNIIIPTPQQLAELQEESAALRRRWQDAQRRRAGAQRAAQDATASADLAQHVMVLPENMPQQHDDDDNNNDMIQTVTAAAQALVQAQTAGARVRHAMEQQQARGPSIDDDVRRLLVHKQPNNANKSLWEQYAVDQQMAPQPDRVLARLVGHDDETPYHHE